MAQTFALVNLRNPTKINFLLDGDENAFSTFLSKISDTIMDLKYFGTEITNDSLCHLKLVSYRNNLPVNEYHFSVSRMGLVDSYGSNFAWDTLEYNYQLNQINLCLGKESLSNNLKNTKDEKKVKQVKQVKQVKNTNPSKSQINKLTSMMSKFKSDVIQIKKPHENAEIPEMIDTEEENAKLRGEYDKNWKNINDGVSDITTDDYNSDDDSISEYSNSDKESIFDPDLLDDEDLENLDPELIEEMYQRSISLYEEKNKELEEKKDSLEKQKKNYGRFIDKLNDEKRIIRVLEEKEEQRKRIFESDKSVYYKIFKQLEDGKTSEKHIPIFFKEKYPLFKYMDENSFLEDEKEYSIYLLLFNKLNSKDDDKKNKDKVKSLNIYQQYYLDEDELNDLQSIYKENKEVIDNVSEYIKSQVTSTIPSFEEAMANAESDNESDNENHDDQVVMTVKTHSNKKIEEIKENPISDTTEDDSDGLSSYVTSEEEDDEQKDDKLETINEDETDNNNDNFEINQINDS